MCAAFPKTPVVIDHFARIGMRGAIDRGGLDRLLALAKFPLVHVKTEKERARGVMEDELARVEAVLTRARSIVAVLGLRREFERELMAQREPGAGAERQIFAHSGLLN